MPIQIVKSSHLTAKMREDRDAGIVSYAIVSKNRNYQRLLQNRHIIHLLVKGAARFIQTVLYNLNN